MKLRELVKELKFNPDGSIDRGGMNTAMKQAIKGLNSMSKKTSTDTNNKTDKDKGVLRSGPPYPKEDEQAVKKLQNLLSNAGYSVGSTGVDGKYGPRTSRAVQAFKKDYNLGGNGFSVDEKALDLLDKVDSGVVPMAKRAIGKTAADQSQKITRRNEFGNLKQDAVTQGKIGQVLDLIAGPESSGRYDAVYPGRRRPEIFEMTLDELFRDMQRRGRRFGSSASGRYQYIRKTLQSVSRSMGLDTSIEKFTPELQDEIAIWHLRNNHGLDRWLAGDMENEEFLDRLAKTWAGIPKSSGGSYYAGVLDNKAGMSAGQALASLDDIKTGLA